jgi:hypothetical protein
MRKIVVDLSFKWKKTNRELLKDMTWTLHISYLDS